VLALRFTTRSLLFVFVALVLFPLVAQSQDAGDLGDLGETVRIPLGDSLYCVLVGNPHESMPFGKAASTGSISMLHVPVRFADDDRDPSLSDSDKV
jgi:hypothetical protein